MNDSKRSRSQSSMHQRASHRREIIAQLHNFTGYTTNSKLFENNVKLFLRPVSTNNIPTLPFLFFSIYIDRFNANINKPIPLTSPFRIIYTVCSTQPKPSNNLLSFFLMLIFFFCFFSFFFSPRFGCYFGCSVNLNKVGEKRKFNNNNKSKLTMTCIYSNLCSIGGIWRVR